jgi:glycosyltransferase involved in cell wall biosynthesis
VTTGAVLRVLHVHSGNLFGGVERVCEALASPEAMSSLRSEFALCFSGRLHDTLAAAGAPVTALGPVQMRRPDRLWRARRALNAMLREEPPDAVMVHSSWAQAAFAGCVRPAGIPLVRWLHAPDPGPGWLERWAARSRPAMAIYNSEHTRRLAEARLSGVPGIVQHPLMPHMPPPEAGVRARVRESLGTAAGTIVIALTARLEPLKGHRLLVQALAGLAGEPTWEAWFIGGAQRSEERAYQRAIAHAIDQAALGSRVRWLGERPDVPHLLSAADVYCQPNTAPEGFGMSFIEAMAAGLPVVTTRLGAAPEILDDSCGRLTAAGDAAALTATLASLVADADLRQRLGRAGVKRAAQFSDLSTSTARLAEAIRSVVELAVPS